MIPAILAKIGVPVLTTILSEALGKVDDPKIQEAAKAIGNLTLNERQIAEANRHTEAMAELEVRDRSSALAQVNETIRKEAESNDQYVRRMRPTFGYLMAFTWAAQMFGLAYTIFATPEQAGLVMEGMSHLTGIWGIGLSVLGIYVYKRSEEKKLR
jgi:hypothetical protein